MTDFSQETAIRIEIQRQIQRDLDLEGLFNEFEFAVQSLHGDTIRFIWGMCDDVKRLQFYRKIAELVDDKHWACIRAIKVVSNLQQRRNLLAKTLNQLDLGVIQVAICVLRDNELKNLWTESINKNFVAGQANVPLPEKNLKIERFIQGVFNLGLQGVFITAIQESSQDVGKTMINLLNERQRLNLVVDTIETKDIPIIQSVFRTMEKSQLESFFIDQGKSGDLKNVPIILNACNDEQLLALFMSQVENDNVKNVRRILKACNDEQRHYLFMSQVENDNVDNVEIILQACNDKQREYLFSTPSLIDDDYDDFDNLQLPPYALYLACVNDSCDMVALLLKCGDSASITLLQYAVSQDLAEITQLLLAEPGVKDEIDLQDEEGCTPLHHAAENNRSDLIGILLAAGANPNIIDKEGKTALTYAIEYRNVEMVKFLLAADANPDEIRDQSNAKTALHIVMKNYLQAYYMPKKKEEIREIMKALVNAGARCDLLDSKQRSVKALVPEPEKENLLFLYSPVSMPKRKRAEGNDSGQEAGPARKRRAIQPISSFFESPRARAAPNAAQFATSGKGYYSA